MSLAPRRAPRAYRYVLGDSRREAERLRAQARLWDPTAHALFDRLGVRPGWRVLEIGPGQGSLHVELRRRVRGPVDFVERSEVFQKQLRARCARDGRGEGRSWRTDLIDADLPRGAYDLIFARWVFLFLPDVEAHLRLLVRALKPGGRLAIMDYHRDTWALFPNPAEWSDFLAADRAFFAQEGGDVSIGTQLPALYRKVGLRVMEIVPTILTGHPGSPMWDWVTTYFLTYSSVYAKHRPLTPAKVARLRRQWIAAGRDRSSLMIGPGMLDVVGTKPRRR